MRSPQGERHGARTEEVGHQHDAGAIELVLALEANRFVEHLSTRVLTLLDLLPFTLRRRGAALSVAFERGAFGRVV